MIDIANGESADNVNSNMKMDLERQRQTLLLSATNKLERQRSLHSEFEACILFSSHLLSYPLSDVISLQISTNKPSESSKNETITNDVKNDESLLSYANTPGGVLDAHNALVESCLPENIDDSAGNNNNLSSNDTSTLIADSIASGQLAQMCKNTALSSALKRAAHLTTLIETVPYDETTSKGDGYNGTKTNEAQNQNSVTSEDYQTYYNFMQLMKADNQPENNHDDSENERDPLEHWFRAFYTRLRDIREYHAKHNTTAKHDLGKDNLSIPLFPVMPSDSEYFDNQNSTSTNATTNKTILEKSKKRGRQGNPEADGYDLSSIISTECSKMTDGGIFSGEEVLGKYLDMNVIHSFVIQKGISSVFQAALNKKNSQAANTSTSSETNSSFSYLDFLSILLSGLSSTIPENIKLKHRKKYMKFLQMTRDYLNQFLSKTTPLLDVNEDIINQAMRQFDLEWKEHGGIDGWEKKPQERAMINVVGLDNSGDTNETNPQSNDLDLSMYSSPQELEQKVDKDILKIELSRLGLKCGGTPLDRAKRLFLTKDTPLDQIPKKHFVKQSQKQKQMNSDMSSNKNISPTINANVVTEGANDQYILSAGNERRIDIARLETVVSALLLQLRPTLDATARRADRRLTQTVNEREREIYEEIYGTSMQSSTSANKKSKTEEGNDGEEEEESDDEDEDTPIYNPKGVPLGWDGKPIPYWLFKLHGLNHFFPCEICGNESYRGRRNFEKHFTESKHAYGMRCLGIPNTKHFHGVVKINDALKLWEKIKGGVEGSTFDGDKDEEYEDSHGNVLKRGEYEDLARQGLL